MTDPRSPLLTSVLFCSVSVIPFADTVRFCFLLFLECFPRAQCHSFFSRIYVLLFLIHPSCRSSIVGLWRIHVTTGASLSLLRYMTALCRASCQKKPPRWPMEPVCAAWNRSQLSTTPSNWRHVTAVYTCMDAVLSTRCTHMCELPGGGAVNPASESYRGHVDVVRYLCELPTHRGVNPATQPCSPACLPGGLCWCCTHPVPASLSPSNIEACTG